MEGGRRARLVVREEHEGGGFGGDVEGFHCYSYGKVISTGCLYEIGGVATERRKTRGDGSEGEEKLVAVGTCRTALSSR